MVVSETLLAESCCATQKNNAIATQVKNDSENMNINTYIHRSPQQHKRIRKNVFVLRECIC